MKFINRKKEMEFLEEKYREKAPHLLVIYGRRRVGKTRLIEEFLRGKKDQLYYLAADESTSLQVKELKNLLAAFFSDEFLMNNNFLDWKQLFSYLEKVWPRDKRLVLVLDEVTYLIKNDPAFPSYLNQFWEKFLSKTNSLLILNGSLVGLMVREVLGGGSPLYGRRTGEIFLEELRIKEAQEFLNQPLEETISIFSILGGVPKYLELVQGNFNDFLEEIFDKRSFFYREGLYLMTEEFKDISTYSNILRAVAEGNTKLGEIADYSGIESKKISAYAEILENVGFITGIIPVTEKKFRGKIYLINDSFLEFWFRFINKNRSLIEMDKKKALLEDIKNEINSFVGKKFEKVCLQFLILSKLFSFTKIGRQWGKIPGAEKDKNQYEIDLCALNEKNKEILFGECKWQEKVEASAVLNELKEKARNVDWHSGQRKEFYVIFAKSFKDKKSRGENVYLFDLKEMEKVFKQEK